VSLRSALECATHGIVIRRRLPSPFSAAQIYVSTEGGLRYLARAMASVDPSLLRLAAEVVRPGDNVWDIGANVGLFSFAAAVAAGPSGSVLAVEPDAVMAGLLRRSVGRNKGLAPVAVLPCAVSSELSVARFNVARRSRATNHINGFGTSQTGGVRSIELAMTVTLDWLASQFPPPDVLKMDVEGAELGVLVGGIEVLRCSPRIICEVSRDSVAVGELLRSHGYAIYDGDLSSHDRVPVSVAPANTLATTTVGAR
jgi:FkbM family methyltransferase